MSVQASCPACGGPVTFRISTSLVTVCPYCQSVVGRSDRGLESLGKVADLVETASPLDVGLKGRFEGHPFDLVGRTQYRHPAGGVWDEWYAAFPDGRWGWLAEAQGRFYMTFVHPLPGLLPSYAELKLGQTVDVGDGLALVVAEKNRGTTASARGEIPYRVIPGEEHPFADLSGPRGEFATLDYSDDAPTFYLGRQVTLDELHIPVQARRTYPGQEPVIQAVHLNCPQCGGGLELRAPDRSERVGCPSCGALSDVSDGQLKLMKSLEPPPIEPLLPLGATGKRDGVEWTVIGFVRRYVTIEGTKYHWEEYLLYQPRLGFRWLTRSDGHWNWVEAIPPASVRLLAKGAHFADRDYRLFQKATARVDFVVGEFYWKVQEGEQVLSRDYVDAPYILSEEVTQDEGDEGEINWSHGVYVPKAEVERMFGLGKPLRGGTGIAPNQPFPYGGVYRTSLYLLVAAVLLGVGVRLLSPAREVYRANVEIKALQVPPLPTKPPEGGPPQQQVPPTPAGPRSLKVIVEEPLKLRRWQNIRVILTPRADASWVHITGSITPVTAPPAPGTPSPPASSAQRHFAFLAMGGQQAYVYLSALPAGEYTLQYDLAPRNPQAPTAAEVRVEQGVSHIYPDLCCTLSLLIVVPFLVLLYQMYFEGRRWSDSNVT